MELGEAATQIVWTSLVSSRNRCRKSSQSGWQYTIDLTAQARGAMQSSVGTAMLLSDYNTYIIYRVLGNIMYVTHC